MYNKTNTYRINQKIVLNLSVFLAIFNFFFFTTTTNASDTVSFWNNHYPKYIKYLDLRIENGVMIQKNGRGGELLNSSYYNGIDFRLGFRNSNPGDVYSNIYRHPYLGVGLYFSTFRNSDLGNPHAIYMFFTHPFTFENNKNLTFSYTGALGISFNFNPYDSIQNPANVLIGSYKNSYIHIGFLANYKFSDNWALNGTIGLKHFSNGSLKLPNYGLNIIPFTLGVSYKFSDYNVPKHKIQNPDFKNFSLFNLTAATGSKNYEANEPNCLKAMFEISYLYQFGYRYRAGLGLDMFYAAQSDLRNDSNESNFSKSFSFAVVGEWEWILTKKLYIPIGIGLYLHRNPENEERQPYYERIGVRYRITDNFSTGLSIKAHKDIADFFEFTLGYTFHKDPNAY